MPRPVGDWVHQPETYGGLTTVGANRYIDLPLTVQPSQLAVAPPVGLGSSALVRLPTTASRCLAVATRGWIVWNVLDGEINDTTSQTFWMGIQPTSGDPDDPTLIPQRVNWNPFFYASHDATHAVWQKMWYRRVPAVGFWDETRPNGRQMAWGIMRVQAKYRTWLEANEQLVLTIANQETVIGSVVSVNFRCYLETYVIPMM